MNPHTSSVLDLMRLQVNALYVCDDRSRLVSVNQWDGGIAPRFFLGRTVEGNLWRFRRDVPHDLVACLETLCRDEPSLEDVQQPPRHHERYIELLSAQAPIEQVWSGPAYRLLDSHVPVTDTVAITERNAYLLKDGFEDWMSDVLHRQPYVAVVEDGKAVSLCASVRITEHAHEAGVESLSKYQRRGYALSAVAAWASIVRGEGAVPLYSTSWTESHVTASGDSPRRRTIRRGLSPDLVDPGANMAIGCRLFQSSRRSFFIAVVSTLQGSKWRAVPQHTWR